MINSQRPTDSHLPNQADLLLLEQLQNETHSRTNLGCRVPRSPKRLQQQQREGIKAKDNQALVQKVPKHSWSICIQMDVGLTWH